MLRLIDSFENYSQGVQTSGVWDRQRNSTSFGWDLTSGRFGGTAWSNNSRHLDKQFDNQGTWIIGGALNFSNAGGDDGVYSWWDGGYDGTVQCALHWSGNTLWVTRGPSTTLTSTTFIPTGGQWYFVEFKVVIANSGSYEVKIDGASYLSGSGVDTQQTGNAYANALRLGSLGDGFFSPHFDDIHVMDGQVGAGSNPCNDFIGDCRVYDLLPNGNGNTSDFLGSDSNSVDNYLLVDELNPNNDTDYVESSTVGNKDTYTYQNLSTSSGTVFGVQTQSYARKTDAGTRKIKTIARLSGTEVDGPEQTLGSAYQYYWDIRETKPGGGDWTIADVNNAEFGRKISA